MDTIGISVCLLPLLSSEVVRIILRIAEITQLFFPQIISSGLGRHE